MKGQTRQKVLKHSLQSTLRNNMTDAERKVWSVLREQQVEDCKFRRQHPDGNDILDFVCLEHGLVIEVDAGQHLDSERDATRDENGPELQAALVSVGVAARAAGKGYVTFVGDVARAAEWQKFGVNVFFVSTELALMKAALEGVAKGIKGLA